MELGSFSILGQFEPPVQQSCFSWMFMALGPVYGLAIPLAGLGVFIGACAVVALSRRPAVIAAYLVFLPLPLLVGLFGSLHGSVTSSSVFAYYHLNPRPGDIAAAISVALFSTLVGLGVTFPSYFVLAAGLFLRTVFSGKTEPK
jgi:hypothetical protein